MLKDFVWKSNISDERCYELDTKLEYSYDLSDSTSEDEISDFSSITPYSFEFIWKLSRSPSLSKVLMHQWMKKNKNKAYEFEIHLGVTVENATQWKQGESLLSRYKWNPWKLFYRYTLFNCFLDVVTRFYNKIDLHCVIYTSNNMFGRAIWDKLLECIFETFWNCKIFKNHEGALSQKLLKPNMWLLVNHTKPTNTVLKLISLDSPQLQNSGQLQNNTVSDIMLITIVWLLISFSRHKCITETY